MGNNAKGALLYHVVYLPEALRHQMGLKKTARYRIVGELEGQPIRLALNPAKGAAHFLIVAKGLMRDIAKSVGDAVCVRFRLDAPNHVEIPKMLREALNSHPEAAATWDTLSPGKQRSWSVFVSKAKRENTQRNRVQEVLERLERNALDPRQAWPPLDD